MKITVVDDEKDMLFLFKQKFRQEIRQGQIEFDFFLSAQEALADLENQEPDRIVLILSDINMPGMSGLEMLKILKARSNNFKVFMITAYGDEYNHRLAREYGADDYIYKPVDFDELKQKILNLQQIF